MNSTIDSWVGFDCFTSTHVSVHLDGWTPIVHSQGSMALQRPRMNLSNICLLKFLSFNLVTAHVMHSKEDTGVLLIKVTLKQDKGHPEIRGKVTLKKGKVTRQKDKGHSSKRKRSSCKKGKDNLKKDRGHPSISKQTKETLQKVEGHPSKGRKETLKKNELQ